MRKELFIAGVLLGGVTFTACNGSGTLPPTDNPPPPRRETLIALADVAACDSQGDEATAALVDTIQGTIVIAGDIAYEVGSTSDFANCYDPSWGRHKARTRPAPGNHEYATPNAAPYFAYFGSNAGPAGRGYYSFDVGDWHVISLNSNIDVSAGSAQEIWLRADLSASTAKCTLAYWHHPLFSSGLHGSDPRMRALWNALYDANADVVISGHDHHYERFGPQTSLGVADAARGIREFVVGTGGRSLYPALFNLSNAERKYDTGYGVLRLSLGPADYTWSFIPLTPGITVDSGTEACH